MKAIIVAGGTPPSKKSVIDEITSNSIIIAADSGADCLWRYKITPDYIIGDFDSIDKKILKFFENKKIPIERHPSNKDFTDSQLALKKALNYQVKKIVFLGCLGGKRIDHSLGALGLLEECSNIKVDAMIKDDHQTIVLVNKSTTISGKPGKIFSLQAYGGIVKNLSITGSRYTLNHYSLKMGDALTISNEFCRKKVKLQFDEGKLLVIKQNA